jgi:rhamnosyltransferase subunit B
MRVILAPVGSHGDVLPLVAVGRELAGRGHAVTLATAEPFRGLAESHGFAFAPTGTQADYDRLTADPDLWHPTRSLKTLFGPPHFERMLRDGYRAIAGAVEPGNTVVVAGSLCLSARLAHDALGVPLATAHLQPTAVPTLADPPHLGAVRVRRWWPTWSRRLLFWGADRFVLDPLMGPPVNRLRGELGLPNVRRVFGPWRHSPQRLLALFPKWYADAPDYPPQLRHVGFLRNDAAVKPTPPEVSAFLAAGPPPVAVSFGTAMRVGGPYFRASAEALTRLGRRGLILAKGGEQIPPDLPPTILHVDYAPFSEVLPRCAALVHHGGIGTTAQALAAGVRQLVMPMAFDQPDNAARLGRLGVARTVWPTRFTPATVAAALEALLEDDGSRQAAARVAARMAAEPDPLPLAADLIERLLVSPD